MSTYSVVKGSGATTFPNDSANALVLAIAFKVTTANASLTDFDLGDGDVTDGYVDGASMATVNDGCSWQTTFNEAMPNTTKEGMSLGKFYTVADTIDFKQNTNATITAGVLKVKALLFDCNLY